MKFRVFLLLAVIAHSCNMEKYDGYTPIGKNMHFLLYSFSENSRKPGDSDIVTYHMKVFGSEHQVVFSSYEIFPKGMTSLVENSGNGWVALGSPLMNMEEGDSASFIFENPEFAIHEDLRKLLLSEALRVDVKLIKVRSKKEYADEIVRLNEMGDVDESILIKNFIKENGLPEDTSGSGIHVRSIRDGHGEFPSPGDQIKIRYTGTFLGGELFDKGEMLFSWGDEMQVIRGLELALSGMRKGSQAKIIIPSYLAYGEKGSTNGVVPPGTPVVYEVEILDLK